MTTPATNQVCTEEYTPVCGCNQQTYSNDCVAATSGITTWTLGECETNENSELSSRTASLRVNYYTSICAGSFTDLTCYHFQIDDEIGTDYWRTDSIYIPDFEHEYGFVYDLEVTITPNDLTNCVDDCPENNYALLRVVSKTQVENPCITAPKPNQVCSLDYTPVCGCDQQTYSNQCIAEASGVTSWTFGECNSDGNTDENTTTNLSSRTANLRVNYYTSLCTGSFTDSITCYHFQIGDEIGTEEWRTEAIDIEGFEYAPGFVYDIEVLITPNDLTNCADDCPDNTYKLISVISKTAVED